MQCFLSCKGFFYCINISFFCPSSLFLFIAVPYHFSARYCLAVLSALILKLPVKVFSKVFPLLYFTQLEEVHILLEPGG